MFQPLASTKFCESQATIIHGNPPYTITIIPSPSKGLSSWRTLTQCLQIYPHCANTKLQLDHSIASLCTMYVMCGFFIKRTNSRHPSITSKVSFSKGTNTHLGNQQCTDHNGLVLLVCDETLLFSQVLVSSSVLGPLQ